MAEGTRSKVELVVFDTAGHKRIPLDPKVSQIEFRVNDETGFSCTVAISICNSLDGIQIRTNQGFMVVLPDSSNGVTLNVVESLTTLCGKQARHAAEVKRAKSASKRFRTK